VVRCAGSPDFERVSVEVSSYATESCRVATGSLRTERKERNVWQGGRAVPDIPGLARAQFCDGMAGRKENGWRGMPLE